MVGSVAFGYRYDIVNFRSGSVVVGVTLSPSHSRALPFQMKASLKLLLEEVLDGHGTRRGPGAFQVSTDRDKISIAIR